MAKRTAEHNYIYHRQRALHTAAYMSAEFDLDMIVANYDDLHPAEVAQIRKLAKRYFLKQGGTNESWRQLEKKPA
jgi:hypothetical protein